MSQGYFFPLSCLIESYVIALDRQLARAVRLFVLILQQRVWIQPWMGSVSRVLKCKVAPVRW